MDDLSAERIDEIVDSIAGKRQGDISLIELLGLSKLMIESLQSLIEAEDDELGGEVRSIARHIQRTQSELSRIPPRELTESVLPEADGDLHEVVRSTENATQTILDSAERIMSASAADVDAYRQVVDEAVVSIFEACCFQDLTGQRIRRVVETLDYVNRHVAYVTDVINGADRKGMTMPTRDGDDLLSGPQTGGDAISQIDADSLFEALPDNVVSFKI
jgi:chemotaxis protein CheZ